MITRPLDLASRLRPEPRNFDWLFFVNLLALVFFFGLFGSAFVVAPGLSIRLPVAAGSNANAKPVTHFITVLGNGLIFTPSGAIKIEQIGKWLADQARTTKAPVLLVRGDSAVPMSVFGSISGMAKDVGFIDVTWATVDSADGARAGGR